jgi:hypothetical protein
MGLTAFVNRVVGRVLGTRRVVRQVQRLSLIQMTLTKMPNPNVESSCCW